MFILWDLAPVVPNDRYGPHRGEQEMVSIRERDCRRGFAEAHRRGITAGFQRRIRVPGGAERATDPDAVFDPRPLAGEGDRVLVPHHRRTIASSPRRLTPLPRALEDNRGSRVRPELSDRHRWSAGLRPASRVSAKPAPTTLRPTPIPHGALASSPGGGLRPASRVSAKPAPITPPPANVSAAPPLL